MFTQISGFVIIYIAIHVQWPTIIQDMERTATTCTPNLSEHDLHKFVRIPLIFPRYYNKLSQLLQRIVTRPNIDDALVLDITVSHQFPGVFFSNVWV